MSSGGVGKSGEADRLAFALLAIAMVAAAALLIWAGRGLTLLVDDWGFGFSARTNFDPDAFLAAYNGHLVAIPILLTKASLQLFGADAALPLRLFAVAVHLTVAALLFVLLRQALGALGALVPAVLVLFLGAANDVLVGSHGLPFTIAVATGLGAWLALGARRLAWDCLATALLVAGIASNGVAVPFLIGAAALIALGGGPPRRYLVVAVPLGLYALWWLAYGIGEGDFAIANLAALPAFAFDSLAAALASITGVFTIPGSRRAGFDLSAGQALAGAAFIALLALVLARRYRPAVATVPALVALVGFWVLTSAGASPARQPFSSRYLYVSVVLLLLVLAREIGASPLRREGTIALAAICALALAPNVRELTYAGDFARADAEQNRAVMAAANLLEGRAPASTLLEDPADLVGLQLADMGFPLEQYEASKRRFGVPALSPEELREAGAEARAAADHLLARGLAIEVRPASRSPRPLPPRLGISQTGGVLIGDAACTRFVPLAAGAQVSLRLPPGGLWLRPGAGPAVPVAIRRFDSAFGVEAGSALGGRASALALPVAPPASTGWHAQLRPEQPVRLCGA